MIDPGTIARLRDVIAFLLGEAPLDGQWYGAGTYPADGGLVRPYWWRKDLSEMSALLALADAVNSAPIAKVEWAKNHADGGYAFGTVRVPDGFTSNSVRLVALPEGE